ncbi:hypothetical protein TBLA_0F04220 [Henningerozyma blattae CBS 6284]|uniref:Mediator of RNA polymerase II transcription subunit 12 n=1 Tax=Henningerozyma blattae (strain ATCC 34711 / CBS 6284 / DSM 70876 / NBRC 10599 / NRRL Y-10934 / UCD 77-7) TaxID=1071380 RepID=I2H6F3_HENB6|nr:hypothetical protein TBLA_0F04220 [Tetrapisispora blattae CBS 6284]CCH61955.1 hypothetical protein TBLA_0F04220 [Tetrapisispora blattae CBS 6284]
MLPTKYLLTPPEELHPYVPDYLRDTQAAIYPDFDPWQHTKDEDTIMTNFVSKGYYTTSKVNFESVSARSSLQDSLPKLTVQLASQFSNVVKLREEEVNRIPALPKNFEGTLFNDLSGPGFSLPTRITLTDHKRELWLQELSSSYASLSKISKYVPHGLKRRQVLEQCYMKQIPIKRAIWLIKCCYSLEWKSLMIKNQNKNENTNNINFQLLKDWTDNYVFIMEKLIFEMNTYSDDQIRLKVWKSEINYFLKLIGNCYSLNLLNKEVFHHWLVEFFSKVENFEFLPLTLHILTTFWDGICQPNNISDNSQPFFLVSKIVETLLQKYYQISNAKSMINDQKYIINDIKKNNSIKKAILNTIKSLVIKLFQTQSLEIFLFPNSSWDTYKPCLYEILNTNNDTSRMTNDIRRKLELVSYRNESLKFSIYPIEKSLGNDPANYFPAPDSNNEYITQLKSVDVKFTKLLDNNSIDYDWSTYIDRESFSVGHVLQLLIWTIHPSRKDHIDSIHLATKILLLRINSMEGSQEYVFEDTIWSLVFRISKIKPENRNSFVNLECLYRLLNLLIVYGIIKVPTYIRKLISSGILYLSDSTDKFFHCDVLINLNISPLTKSQYNMVLKNMMEYDTSYFENYTYDKLLVMSEELKQNLLNGQDDFDPESYPLSVKSMVSEWYLSYLCNGDLKMIDKGSLLRNFRIFKNKLEGSHHLYKWLEFIVYHQLMENIETLEALMDILMCNEKIFSQFINDHILFIKTFIFIYINILKVKDSDAYFVTSFMPFWKFVMKCFPVEITIDEDLRNKMSSVYENEKLKIEKLTKEKQLCYSIHDNLVNEKSEHNIKSNSPGSTPNNNSVTPTNRPSWNFTEIFQINIRILLGKNNSVQEQSRSRKIMLLLKGSNVREYNKFISIFLKRKDFKLYDLYFLIGSKLLTLEQIQKILGYEYIMQLISINSCEDSLEMITPYFEIHCFQFIVNNFQNISNFCIENLSKYYHQFLGILIPIGTRSGLARTSTKIIENLLNQSHINKTQFLEDALRYGTTSNIVNNDLECDIFEDDHTLDELNITNFYHKLDFTNLWLFQSFTSYQISILMKDEDGSYMDNLKIFLFELIDVCKGNCLCSQLLQQISNVDILRLIIHIFEKDFFEKCLSDLGIHSDDTVNTNFQNDNDEIYIPIKIIILLSQRISKISGSSEIKIDNEMFQLICQNIQKFYCLTEENLVHEGKRLEIFLKIFTLHQKSIFHYIVTCLQTNHKNRSNIIQTIKSLFQLFDKISFNLNLKLMLYEILSSLKSYIIYSSTIISDSEYHPVTSSSSVTSASSQNNTMTGNGNNNFHSTLNIPRDLLNLPPFQVSSFIDDKEKTNVSDDITLGITLLPCGTNNDNFTEDNMKKYYLYNVKDEVYESQLHNESYYNISNYQSDHGSSFNNSCLNLSLFNTAYERRNPK